MIKDFSYKIGCGLSFTPLALFIMLTNVNIVWADGNSKILPDACTNPSTIVKSNPYRTTVWSDNSVQSGVSGKFMYGGYTTLISSHIMGINHKELINALNNADSTDLDISRRISDFENDYCNQTDSTIRSILSFAQHDMSDSIFEEERSAIVNDVQNTAFINAMPVNIELKPVDNIIIGGAFQSNNFQYNTHRGLYNSAYGIPQNSLASIVNAYVSGIRSVEFDVLETLDNKNIVIHDLTTNNTTGNFNSPPEYVSLHKFSDLKNRPMDILNPLKDTPTVQKTNVNNMLLSERFLYVIHKFLPGMTAYIDARNNAPVSMIEILNRHPEYKDNIVIKVYPFTLKGGVNSLVNTYKRYTNGNAVTAAADIAKIHPNVLLAMGSAATQANEVVSANDYSTFNWNMFRSSSVLPKLPFTRSNTWYNQRLKKPFTYEELIAIESMTYNLSKWAFDFSAITNVMVYQVNINPSLKYLIDNNNTTEIDLMPVGDKILSAAIDNFVTLFNQVKNTNSPIITLNLPDGSKKPLQNELKKIRWGFSDRYPDYTFALKNNNDSVKQETIRDFLYNMEGTVYERNDYSAMKMRSTRAAMDKIIEMKAQGLNIGYATTDLPTDLRQGAMGLLGKNNLPSDITYRASALIKQKYLPKDIAKYVRPEWTNHLYGDVVGKDKIDIFNTVVANILKQKNSEIPRLEGAIEAINTAKVTFNQGSVPITNQTVLSIIGAYEPVFYKDKSEQLNQALNILQMDLKAANFYLKVSLDEFKEIFDTDYIWEPSFQYFPVTPKSNLAVRILLVSKHPLFVSRQ